MKKYIILLIASLFVGITTNVGHPITPYYINQLGLDKIVFTYFFAAMSLGMLVSAPFWGSLGDTYGRKWIIITNLIFYGVGQALFGYFHTVGLITFARVISGLFAGGILVNFMSYISRSKELRKYNQARLIATFISMQTVGVSLGSFIGGYLGDILNPNYQYVLYIQAGLMCLFAIYVLVFINFNDEEKSQSRSMNPFIGFKNLKYLTPALLVVFVVIIFNNICFTNTSKYLDVYFSDSGYGSLQLGTINLVIGIVTLLINITLTPFLIRKFNQLTTLLFCCIIGSICLYITFKFSNLLTGIYTVYMIYIIAKAIIEPTTVSYLSKQNFAPGLLMGLRQSFISLGGIIGIIIGGSIYAAYGVSLFTFCSLLLIFSSILIISIIVCTLIRKKAK